MENIEFIYRFSIEGPLEDASRKLVTGYLWQIDGLLNRATRLLQKTLPENVRVACSLDGTGQDAMNDQEEMIRLQVDEVNGIQIVDSFDEHFDNDLTKEEILLDCLADDDCLPLYAEVPAATIERIQAAGYGVTDRRTVQAWGGIARWKPARHHHTFSFSLGS